MQLLALFIALSCASSPQEDPQRAERIDQLYKAFRAASFKESPEVRWQERTDDDVIVDARSVEERAVSMVPGALSVDQLGSPETYADKRILLYCTIGYRSGLETLTLRTQGYDAYNLRGGILAYTHTQGVLVHEGTPTRRVHTWSDRFDLVADGYEGVSSVEPASP